MASPLQDIDNQMITINITGVKFAATRETLLKYPDTRLALLVADGDVSPNSLFFERDAETFKEVLKFYQSDELHCPTNICFSDFLNQLDFWKIDTDNISDCCSQALDEEAEIGRQLDYFDRRIPYDQSTQHGGFRQYRHLIWSFLTDPNGPNTRWRCAAKIWAAFYLFLTFANGICYALETLPIMWQREVSANSTANHTSSAMGPYKMVGSCNQYTEWKQYKGLQALSTIDIVLTIFFAVEIWIRFGSCPEKCFFWKSINGLDMLISNVECAMYAFFLFVNHELIPSSHRYDGHHSYCAAAHYLETTALLFGQARLLRLLSYASIYSGLKVLLIALFRSWREVLLLIVLIVIAVLIFGPLAFYLSVTSAKDETIDSIPKAYWFVVVTMTTVGYGDTYPTTYAGYLIAVLVMITGLMITALPIAIVGGNFSLVYEYSKKKEKQRERKTKKMKDYKIADTASTELTDVERAGQLLDVKVVGNGNSSTAQ